MSAVGLPVSEVLLSAPAVLAVMVVPLTLSLLAFGRAGQALGWLGAVGALPAVCIGLLLSAHDGRAGIVLNHVIDWLLLGARFGLDAHSADFLLLSGVLWMMASIAAQGYFDSAARRRMAPWWMLAMTGNLALPIAIDPVTYFTFFALMSFASYGLVVFRMNEAAEHAARSYIRYVIIGEVLLFCALVLAETYLGLALVLLLLGYGIKVGVFGLHAWLPLAHGVAPAPASAVLSAAMLKAGLLGWLRFYTPFDAAPVLLADILLVLGLAGAFGGVFLGLLQQAPKTLLAYSSVSQMGLISVAFALLLQAGIEQGPAMALIGVLALHHAFAKGALFLGVALAERTVARARLVALALLAVPAMALVGLPGTTGAAAKAALGALATNNGAPWGALATYVFPVAALGTALLMARLFQILPAGDGRRAGPSMWLPCIVLVGAGFAMAHMAPGERWSAAGSWLMFGVTALLALAAAAAWRMFGRSLRLTFTSPGIELTRLPGSEPGETQARIWPAAPGQWLAATWHHLFAGCDYIAGVIASLEARLRMPEGVVVASLVLVGALGISALFA